MTQVQTDPRLQAEWPEESAGPPPEKRPRFWFLRELPALLVIAFAIALLLKTFLVQAFYIPSESMLPTLEVKDRVLVNKLAYRFRDPRRGEVIVFVAERFEQDRSLPQKVVDFLVEGLGVAPPRGERDFIKRIIGLPGDTIVVNDKGVYITPPGGRAFKLNEPYIFSKEVQGPPQEKFKVPKDNYFVMGDNRGNSSDSRSSLGTIAREDIIGKAFVRIWPPGRIGQLEEPIYRQPTRKQARPTPSPSPAKGGKGKKKKAATGDAAPAGEPAGPGLPWIPVAAIVLSERARGRGRGIATDGARSRRRRAGAVPSRR